MADDPHILRVFELSALIKKNIEGSFPSIWLQGEVSNAKLHSSGHFYFTLKDKEAQISAIMFRGAASSLKKMPADGEEVIVHGALNVWPQGGKYQIVVDHMRPTGLGELLLKLEELKKELNQLGYFKKEHKKPLPKFPKTIGVVTSPTGAAIQDILHILTRRFSGFHLILNPVKVQGEGAKEEIAQAIRDFNTYTLCDVMIVGRGGGSIEDLWAFNERCVADAIFESKIPIVCAVGHETDHSIAEYVADVRAPTPSAAAEIVLGEKGALIDFIDKGKLSLDRLIAQKLDRLKERLEVLKKQPALASPYLILGPWMQRLDVLKSGIDKEVLYKIKRQALVLEGRALVLKGLNPKAAILRMRERLVSISGQIDRREAVLLEQKRERILKMEALLVHINPKNLLKKGYAILFKGTKAVASVKEMASGDRLEAELSDGRVELEVV